MAPHPNPFLDRRGQHNRRIVEAHYLRRLARVGSVVLAVTVTLYLVWDAHEEALSRESSSATASPPSDASPDLWQGEDSAVSDIPVLNADTRASLESIPDAFAPAQQIGRRQEIDVSSIRIRPLLSAPQSYMPTADSDGGGRTVFGDPASATETELASEVDGAIEALLVDGAFPPDPEKVDGLQARDLPPEPRD